MTKTMTVDGIEYPLDTDKTLLDNLESQAINVEFHCRDGHCGACRCTLLSGEISYVNFPMAYLRENEILLCSSKTKEDIVITT